MKQQLILLLLVTGRIIQAQHYTSPNPTVQKELDRCRQAEAPATSGITDRYNTECIRRVKKKYPGQVHEGTGKAGKAKSNVASRIHAGE